MTERRDEWPEPRRILGWSVGRSNLHRYGLPRFRFQREPVVVLRVWSVYVQFTPKSQRRSWNKETA